MRRKNCHMHRHACTIGYSKLTGGWLAHSCGPRRGDEHGGVLCSLPHAFPRNLTLHFSYAAARKDRRLPSNKQKTEGLIQVRLAVFGGDFASWLSGTILRTEQNKYVYQDEWTFFGPT